MQYCIEHAGTTLHRNIVSIVSKHVWDNIAQENYLRNVDLEHADILSLENQLFKICLVACLLTGCNIIKQSWLFLFNVGLGICDLQDNNEQEPTLTGTIQSERPGYTEPISHAITILNWVACKHYHCACPGFYRLRKT